MSWPQWPLGDLVSHLVQFYAAATGHLRVHVHRVSCVSNCTPVPMTILHACNDFWTQSACRPLGSPPQPSPPTAPQACPHGGPRQQGPVEGSGETMKLCLKSYHFVSDKSQGSEAACITVLEAGRSEAEAGSWERPLPGSPTAVSPGPSHSLCAVLARGEGDAQLSGVSSCKSSNITMPGPHLCDLITSQGVMSTCHRARVGCPAVAGASTYEWGMCVCGQKQSITVDQTPDVLILEKQSLRELHGGLWRSSGASCHPPHPVTLSAAAQASGVQDGCGAPGIASSPSRFISKSLMREGRTGRGGSGHGPGTGVLVIRVAAPAAATGKPGAITANG